MAKQIKFFFILIGCVIGAGAVIGCIQRILNVGLAPELQALLDYYRAFIHPILAPINFFIDKYFTFYHVVGGAQSLDRESVQTLGLMAVTALLRGAYVATEMWYKDDPRSVRIATHSRYIVGYGGIAILCIFTDIGLLVALLAAVSLILMVPLGYRLLFEKNDLETRYNLLAGTMLGFSVIASAFCVVAFYVTNDLMQR